MANANDLFAELNGDPVAVAAEFNGNPETVASELSGHHDPTDRNLRQACHFTVAFMRDGQWCEDRWGESTEYYCGPCRNHHSIRS